MQEKLLHCQPLIVCFLKTVMIVFNIEVIFICQKIYSQMKWKSKDFIYLTKLKISNIQKCLMAY